MHKPAYTDQSSLAWQWPSLSISFSLIMDWGVKGCNNIASKSLNFWACWPLCPALVMQCAVRSDVDRRWSTCLWWSRHQRTSSTGGDKEHCQRLIHYLEVSWPLLYSLFPRYSLKMEVDRYCFYCRAKPDWSTGMNKPRQVWLFHSHRMLLGREHQLLLFYCLWYCHTIDSSVEVTPLQAIPRRG